MLYVDLGELPQLVADGIISDRRLSLAALLPEDHANLAGDLSYSVNQESALSFRDRVAQHVQKATNTSVAGPIRLLTQLSYLGYYFSPLNLYYCFDEQDSQLMAVVAEVSNTPWREQHIYVLHDGNRTDAHRHIYSHPKSFHVSPFMDMNLRYHWVLTPPAETLGVHLSNSKDGEGDPLFTARMQMTRRTLSRASLARMIVRYPMMTAQIMGAIYFQALKLWWKKCPYYPHPKNQSSLPQARTAN